MNQITWQQDCIKKMIWEKGSKMQVTIFHYLILKMTFYHFYSLEASQKTSPKREYQRIVAHTIKTVTITKQLHKRGQASFSSLLLLTSIINSRHHHTRQKLWCLSLYSSQRIGFSYLPYVVSALLPIGQALFCFTLHILTESTGFTWSISEVFYISTSATGAT